MNQRDKRKSIEHFGFWHLQNKITLFSLIGILLLSALFAIASIVLPNVGTTQFVFYIVLVPALACFGIATCHSSSLEAVKAKREYQQLLTSMAEAEGSQITLDRFFSISTDLMAVAGNDGKLKKVSKSLISTLGYPEEKLLSTPFIDFIHPEDKERTIQSIEALNLGIRSVGFENRYRAADGTYRTLSWSAAADAELGVRFASARDVTADRIYKDRVQQIFDSVPFLLVVKDRDGIITNCNAAFARSVDTSRDLLIGKSAEHLFSFETNSINRAKDKEVLNSQHSVKFAEIQLNQGVAVRYLSTVFPIHDEAGQIVSIGKASLDYDSLDIAT